MAGASDEDKRALVAHYILFHQEPVQNLLSESKFELPEISTGNYAQDDIVIRTYKVKHGETDDALYEDFLALRAKVQPHLESFKTEK